MIIRPLNSVFAGLALLGIVGAAACAAQEITIEKVGIPGPSLEGNLEGNATTRDLIVFLPPSYTLKPDRRYPVVYALHGYSVDNDVFAADLKNHEALEGAYAAGVAEMIIVMPDAQTVHDGSMYTASVTTGDWESYIADDVVSYVDAHYRTIPTRESRGLTGHSMGGYGTLRIGMKRPDVFSSLYSMSPCCLLPSSGPEAAVLAALEGLEKPEDSFGMGFFERATLASAAAWSPNPTRPPFYFDLPAGDDADSVMARWAANAPVSMADQYMFVLGDYDGIAIDIGDKDWLLPGAKEMDEVLSDNGIDHSFEIYDGDHVNRVADRFEHNVMPFFADKLVFE